MEEMVLNTMKDRLWEVVFEQFYDASFMEMLASRMISFWKWVDDAAKIAIALTTSGSTVAGLAIWNLPQFHWLWVAISACCALLAIVHSSFSVSDRLRAWEGLRVRSTKLRNDFECLLNRMKMNAGFDINQLDKDYQALKKELIEIQLLEPADQFANRSRQLAAQADLNEQIKDMLES